MIHSFRHARLAVITAGALTCCAHAHAGDIRNGAKLYGMHCESCHGTGGRNVMPEAPNFARGERMLQPDGALLASIRNGKRAMPGYLGVLSDREILDVVGYLRTLR